MFRSGMSSHFGADGGYGDPYRSGSVKDHSFSKQSRDRASTAPDGNTVNFNSSTF